MKIFVGVLLLVHGLVTAAQSIGYFGASSGGTANPGWLGWWPTTLGESWLPALRGTQRPALADSLTGVLWLVAGAALIAAALGLFGFLVPPTYWRALAGAGAIVSLVLLVVYAHPLYAIGFAADLAVLLVLLLGQWPSPETLGS